MAGRPRSIDNTKIFDVARPSSAKPMGTSRPVIVSHAAPIKDPTIISISGAEEANAKLAAPSVSRKIISPITESEVPAPQETSSIAVLSGVEESTATAPVVSKVNEFVLVPDAEDSAQTETGNAVADESAAQVPETEEHEVPVSVAQNQEGFEEPIGAPESVGDEKEASSDATIATEEAPEPAVTTTDKETKSETPAEQSSGSESASVDALAEASTKPKEDAKKAEEDAKKAAALQELIDSKKYFVPLAHDSTQKQGGSNAYIVLLLVIILAAGIYAAIDAKVIHTSIPLPYHLFKQ